ncbi:PqiC family protein [Primorskyibacter sedentarius]|uniref:PqiC family protein n=1 Tax=Primorskyibacter sedentarius TaxID=745311 RepID=UPI003EBE009A
MFRMLLPLVLLLVSACAGTEPRYLIDPPEVKTVSRLAVSSIEVREVSLPTYAEGSEILMEGEDGALMPIDNAAWADDPVRAVTLSLADQMGRASTATVAAEPWPLEEGADVSVHVRVTAMVARADGTFDLTGQYALSSFDKVVRERVARFDISIPLPANTPSGIALATSQSVTALSDQILTALRR